MGCCESRDDDKRQKKMKSHSSQKMTRKLNILSLQDQDLVAIPEASPNSRQLHEKPDPKSQTLYVDWCKSAKKWEELTKLTSDNTEITEAPAYISWATKPRTIGSLAIVYLCIEIKKNPAEVHSKIEPIIKDLIFQIPLKQIDFQENSMLLLFFFLDNVNDTTVRVLVKFGAFGVINKFLNSERKEMKHLTICVCSKIYKNSVPAQEAFLNFNGGFKLIGLLKDASGFGEGFVGDLVSGIIDLIFIDGVGLIESNLKRLNSEVLWEEVDRLSKQDLSAEMLEKVDFLVSILSSSSNL